MKKLFVLEGAKSLDVKCGLSSGLLPFTVEYTQQAKTGLSEVFLNSEGATIGTVDTPMLAAAPAGMRRVVKEFSVLNTTALQQQVIITLKGGSQPRIVADVRLDAGFMLTSHGVFDTFGRLVTTAIATPANASVTNAMLISTPANTLKGNGTGATAAPQDLTKVQANTLLGTYAKRVTAQAANFTVTTAQDGTLFTVTTAATNRVVTLPTLASAGNGFIVGIQKVDTASGNITTSPATVTLTAQNHSVVLVSDGTNWLVHQTNTGAAGVSSFSYVGYADDASGTGFSLTPAGKNFVAFRTSNVALTPVAADFVGLWRQYVGSSTGSTLPTKRVYLTGEDTTSINTQRIIDASTLRVYSRTLSQTNGEIVVAKNGTAGRIYQAGFNTLHALSNNLELTDTVLDARTGENNFTAGAGAVYDPISDAVYCVNGNTHLTKITNATFTITSNTTNPISTPNGIVIGAGRVFVFTFSNSISVFDTSLNYISDISFSGAGFGVFNPDRNLLIGFRSTGYVEIHPTTFAQNPVSILAGGRSIAYGNGKYVIDDSGTIRIVNATTNTVITTLGIAQGVPSVMYHAALFFDGKFFLYGDGVLIVIDATSNALLKRFIITPLVSATRYTLSSHDVS